LLILYEISGVNEIFRTARFWSRYSTDSEVTWVQNILEETVRQPLSEPEAKAEAETEQKRVREHPEWARLEQAILNALGPFPEVARAVPER
jgi:hypothetical protein